MYGALEVAHVTYNTENLTVLLLLLLLLLQWVYVLTFFLVFTRDYPCCLPVPVG